MIPSEGIAQEPLPAAVGFDDTTDRNAPAALATTDGVNPKEKVAMADGDDRLRILKMVEDGRISAAEGAQLLSALGGSAPRPEASVATTGTGRWFRVRVTDTYSGRTKVNVTLPLGLVNVAVRFGARFVPDHEREIVDELSAALRDGLTGRIVDVLDDEDGERVEVYVD
jgi:hypothetical protein